MASILGAQSFNQKRSFWKRQFTDTATRPQLVFDVIFGIVMPVICFYFDPGIIRSHYRWDGYLSLGQHAITIYMFSGFAILGLMFWMGLRKQANRYAPLIGGLFVSAATFSFLLGVLMLPASLIGLIIIIGALGFTPFATGLVFLRNGVRAINQTRSSSTGRIQVKMIATAALLAFCVPLVTSWQLGRAADRAVNQIVLSDHSDSALSTARHLRWFADANPIMSAYANEKDAKRRDRLARAYREITGEDINQRLMILND